MLVGALLVIDPLLALTLICSPCPWRCLDLTRPPRTAA